MSTADPQWPPRSPHEVLLSTPGGRDRLRRLAERASPSPSPTKRLGLSLQDRAKERMNSEVDMDEEEDEETLQLQLQEIQARLRLKKIQKKSRTGAISDTENEQSRPSSVTIGRSNSVAASRAESRMEMLREGRLERSKSQTDINVPVSPVRRIQTNEQRSPGRVVLGIDKGLKGRDVSLKRAPSLRRREESQNRDRLTGPFLQRTGSQPANQTAGTTSSLGSRSENRTKTFSERMAAVRQEETDRQERDLRIKQNRTTAFDIDHDQMRKFKEAATELPELPQTAPDFSREKVLNSYNKPSGDMPRSNIAPNLRTATRNTNKDANRVASNSDRPASGASAGLPAKSRNSGKSRVPPNEVPESEATEFEPYSSKHLSKRIIPHNVLTRTLTGRKTFLLPDLLRTVKSPDFQLPDIEEDIVLFGIIAKKTEPKAHTDSKRGKFMIMTLTDLKWEIDLFLFSSGFEKFWKLTVGTIIAILNPGIMAPRRGLEDTGKFSLTINSDADTVLEIGNARDLGFCKSVRKDGKTCESWVDKRHTEFCDYHVNESLKKTHASRAEVNTMTFGKGSFGKRTNGSRDMTNHAAYLAQKNEEKKTRYDRESHSQIYIGKKSTASLLDDVDFDPDAFHRGTTKEERLTRRLLEQEKERELKKKLKALGTGIGADYMRHDHRDASRGSSQAINPSINNSDDAHQPPPPPDAASLGLLSGKAKDVALSPIKRKRVKISSSSTAMGWGSHLTKELGRMKNGENLQPMKKKTRFVTEKGIREAGRESFGGETAAALSNGFDNDDDDEDDLDIVRE